MFRRSSTIRWPAKRAIWRSGTSFCRSRSATPNNRPPFFGAGRPHPAKDDTAIWLVWPYFPWHAEQRSYEQIFQFGTAFSKDAAPNKMRR
jgi:hypothetical protein